MLVTFYSDAHENVVMFGNVALTLLQLMGHSGTVPGAILAKDLPAALEKLEIKIQRSSTPSEKNEDNEDSVALSHRAIPLIKLLKNSIKANCDVLWK